MCQLSCNYYSSVNNANTKRQSKAPEMKSLTFDQVPVSEAAEMLEVHPSRVRALIGDGQLLAQKLSGRWFVDRRSLESRRSRPSVDGRPFSEANAWALLCLSEGQQPDWISKWELSRLRRRLREDGLEKLAPRLRSRASRALFRAHRSLLPKLIDDPRLLPSGVSMAAEYQIDIVDPNEFEAYVSPEDLEEVLEQNYLEPSWEPNVIFHVAGAQWLRRYLDHAMSAVVSALDLLEADDEKSRRAGRNCLARISSCPDNR